jgi:hypothetical protein
MGWLSLRGSSCASRRRTAKEGSAWAATTTTSASAVCASMRAFMSAICSRTSARVAGRGLTEFCGEPRSWEAGGKLGG